MENYSPNHAKKLARLFYQDRIWQLSASGKSTREITQLINSHYLPRSKFKGVTLSKSTIHTIIKSSNIKKAKK